MISRSAVFRVKAKLQAALGQANANRVETIAHLLNEDGRATLSQVLVALYPNLPKEKALNNFRQFRTLVNAAAETENLNLTIETDGQKKRSQPESRAVWFEGDDEVTQGANQIIEAEIHGLYRAPQMAAEIGTITYDFAHANSEGADLIQQIENHLKSDPSIRFIRTQGADCDVLIELISPVYLATEPRHPRLCRQVPVLYSPISQRRLGPQQLFTYEDRAWRDSNKKQQFAIALCDNICKICQEPWTPTIEFPDYGDTAYVTRNQGAATDLNKDAPNQLGERRDALHFLHDWCQDATGPRYCALLGEYGIGKTTTAKQLAAERKDRNLITIYLDLRLIGKEAAEKDIELTRILDIVLTKSWKSGSLTAVLKPQEAVKLVREHGALIIFDGLDEVLVHLPPTQGQHFTRELFRVLPPALKSKGKMLVTCRSHYFRTFRDQATHLTAEGRDNIQKEHYRAFVLLPFSEKQITEYLKHTLPNEDPARVLELFSSVHNLREMAERPYTLSLLAKQFHQIEQWKASGEKVTGYRLYGHMVREWLERDAGKHTLTTDHKQSLMEFFAAELWKSGQKTWKIGDIETWMLKFLRDSDDIAVHYDGVSRELLKEDLRTATFLVREGDDAFRFAHTSLQEYFLAGYLRRALLDGKPERWAIPRVSRETLDFLGQALNAREIEPLKQLRESYQPLASEQGFEYYLVASGKDYPRIIGSGFQLPGADLRERQIENADLPNINLEGARLRHSVWRNINLRGGNLASADAPHAEFHDCICTQVNLRNANLTAAVFRGCGLESADFAGANLYRAQRGVQPYAGGGALAPQVGHSGAVGACAFSPDGSRILSASDDGSLRIWDAHSGESTLSFIGHSSFVTACAFSPDGSRILSASHDQSLRLWNAQSGESILSLIGHSSSVTACAFSPDGTRILSASDDKSLRLWNAQSGESILSLIGHSSSVTACAFSPDGSRILSASHDQSLRLWNAHTGESILSLVGHSRSLNACAFSPDGSRILSASADRTLRLWNAHSGELILSLIAHSDWVRACAFSPDGSRILSASADRTLRLWNAHSGESILTFIGHSSYVNACAFSPDGSRILSASHDQSLRLWNAQSGESILSLIGHSSAVTSCAFSSDGSRILSASGDKSLRLWNAQSGESIRSLIGHSSSVTACAFSPDGTRILSASADGSLRIWDAHSGESILSLIGHSSSVAACAFSPDGSRILSASRDQSLRLWDAHSGESILSLIGHYSSVTACAFSPGGSRILSASADGSLRIWGAHSGESSLSLIGHSSSVTYCAFSPDGSRILSASADRTLRLWNAQSGESIRSLTGHSRSIYACAFSPDGFRLLSASHDKSLRLWNAHSGESILSLIGHSSSVTACAFSPDGSRILSASNDGTLRLWDAQTGQQIGWRAYHFPDGGDFSVTVAKPQRILSHGPNAWRYVRWEVRDDENRLIDLLPAGF